MQAWSWTATVRANTDSEAVTHGAAPSPFTAALAKLRVEASRATSWRPLELHAVQLLASFPLSDAYQRSPGETGGRALHGGMRSSYEPTRQPIQPRFACRTGSRGSITCTRIHETHNHAWIIDMS